MSDIIDINVTPTFEQVEISVTENVTTVNINTIQQSGDNNAVKLTTNQTIEGVKTFVSSPIVPTATTANQAVNFGQLNLQTVLEGGRIATLGIVVNTEASDGIYLTSVNDRAAIFNIGASNENNITEFKKGGDLQAAVTHDGKIIGADATEPNQMVTLGQLNTGLDTKLDASLYNDRFKGKFTTLGALESAFPTANAGDYAQVDAGAGSLVRNYNYDLEDGWILGGTGAGATSTDTLIEGSINLYFTTARALSTLLSGLSLVTGGAIVSTDSVLVAFGKLQKQITDAIASIFWTKTGNNIRNNNVGNVELVVGLGGGNDGEVGIYDRNTPTIKRASITSGGVIRANNYENLNTGAGIFFDGLRMLFSSFEASSQLPLFAFNPTYLGSGVGAPTTGELNVIGFTNQTVNPTSGNRIFNFFNLSPIINQTGGANGITRGIYINPTLTSATDFRALEITTGKVIIPTATAPNEAVNLSQLQSENNVYISHEFLSSLSSEDFAITAVNSGSFGAGVATVNNVGVHRITSSSTANSGVGIRSSSLLLRLKGNEIFTYIFNPLTFANTTSRLGFHDSTSSALPANGVYFEYSNNGDLKTVTEDNNVITSPTLATLTTNTWYKVRFTVNANATSVLFQLFNNVGTLIASVTQTTNIPNNTRALNICAITTNSGTTATALLDVDFISTKLTLTR